MKPEPKTKQANPIPVRLSPDAANVLDQVLSRMSDKTPVGYGKLTRNKLFSILLLNAAADLGIEPGKGSHE